ncbi:unnamed protein product [Rodentolepis nana]|uniref:SWIRM domain-containing protein n=1 Tax=Rodentolepis nana TaxID=102285 RepID=A0A0R3T568_RODNA|nr:unnamed protein product [Rodentolepis nana]
MARGRPRRQTKSKSDTSNADGESTEKTISEGSDNENRPGSTNEESSDIQINDDEENPSEEDYESTSTSSCFPRKRKLTEGNIDVDEEFESAEDEEEQNSDNDYLDESFTEVQEETDESEDSLPTDLPLSFNGDAEKAAEICRLPARRITVDEIALFPFLQEETNVALRPAYLIARNAGCALWIEDPTLQVTTDRLMGYLVSSLSRQYVLCMHSAGLTTFIPPTLLENGDNQQQDSSETSNTSCTNTSSSQIPSNWDPWSTPAARKNLERLATFAILFLERYGYINFGSFKHLTEPLTKSVKSVANESSTSASSKKNVDRHSTGTGNPLKVIICGAGAAGLMAARQLTYFGAHVTVLEARDRIGGRVWTYKQGKHFADLGAMIVTGMLVFIVAGNPSTILAKQGGLALIPINPCCTLYNPYGDPVPQERDLKIEKEFNRILATAAYVAANDPNSANKSLGQVIENLIESGSSQNIALLFQEYRITPLQISHRNLTSLLTQRKAKILGQLEIMHEMVKAREDINIAFNEWKTVESNEPLEHKNSSTPPPHSAAAATVSDSTAGTSSANRSSKRRRVNAETGSTVSVSSADSPSSSMPNVRPVVKKKEAEDAPSQPIDMEEKFKRLCQLSTLSAAWRRFDPLHVSLTKVNRQLEVLAKNPPPEIYLTNAERNILDWHLANLEFANSTELDNLSLLHWDQDDAYELSGDHCVIQGGFGQILEVLTTSYGSHRSSNDNPCGQIELQSFVKEISVSDTVNICTVFPGVKVSCVNKAMSEDELISHNADIVLCALPLGVLKESVNITKAGKKLDKATLTNLKAPLFNPPLPQWKTEAIERAGFGTLNKVVLFFDKFFWDQKERVFGYVHDSTDKRGELFLFWSITDRPCLIALVAGKAAVVQETEIATSVIAKGDSDPAAYLRLPIVRRAMSILRKIFNRPNNIIPDPVGAYATHWTSDEYARGSYSYVAVGSSGDDYDLLAAPLTQQPPTLPLSPSAQSAMTHSNDGTSPKNPSRLFFTGEHTNRNYPASVQGAVFASLREVARIMNTYCPGETPIIQHGFTLRSSSPQTEALTLV